MDEVTHVSDTNLTRDPHGRARPTRSPCPPVRRRTRWVVWLTQEQLVTYFIVVMVFVIAMMALVAALDTGFGEMVFAVFTQGQ